jgi:DNA-binding XRE family transcriptional regulator
VGRAAALFHKREGRFLFLPERPSEKWLWGERGSLMPMKPKELKAARATFGLTHADFASVLAVNESTLRRWERAIHPVPEPIANLVRLAVQYDPVRRQLGISEWATPAPGERAPVHS